MHPLISRCLFSRLEQQEWKKSNAVRSFYHPISIRLWCNESALNLVKTQQEHNRPGFGERTSHDMVFGLCTQQRVIEIHKGAPSHHNRFIGRRLCIFNQQIFLSSHACGVFMTNRDFVFVNKEHFAISVITSTYL